MKDHKQEGRTEVGAGKEMGMRHCRLHHNVGTTRNITNSFQKPMSERKEKRVQGERDGHIITC